MSTLGIKQVIVARRDLEMPPGKLAAQVAHGALSFIGDPEPGLAFFSGPEALGTGYFALSYKSAAEREWLHGSIGFTKVVLGVADEDELMGIARAAAAANLTTRVITDSGFTVFENVPTRTVVAIGPDTDERIDPITGHLELY